MNIEDQASQEEAVIVSCADDDQSDDSNAEDDIGNEMTLGEEDDKEEEEEVMYYNEHMDEDDEAWVYRHLRGGTAFTNDHDSAENRKKRSSDTTLSCPCCFTIVCMDCQQHVKYKNQYRAMFVMNIEVQWEKTYVYDDEEQKLITPPPPVTSINQQQQNQEQDISITKVEDETLYYNINSAHTESKDLYYSVHCNQCKAQVAALCMYDEVYYFFDCIATFA